MAYLAFIRKSEDVGFFNLEGPTVLGRSFDCDVYIPDIAVSREHCRLERTEQGWVASDLESENGIYFQGRRVQRRVLHQGDVIEVGTVAVRFEDDELPGQLSSPTPFGEGPPLTELMDTLHSGGIRPILFVRSKVRQPRWKLSPVEEPVDELDLLTVAEAAEPEIPHAEWTELDVEFQVADEAETFLQAWVEAARAEFAAMGLDVPATPAVNPSTQNAVEMSFAAMPVAHATSPASIAEVSVGRARSAAWGVPAGFARQLDPKSVETTDGPGAAAHQLAALGPKPGDVATWSPNGAPGNGAPGRWRASLPQAAPGSAAESAETKKAKKATKAAKVKAPRRPVFEGWGERFGALRAMSMAELIGEAREFAFEKPRVAIAAMVLFVGMPVGYGLFELFRPSYHSPKTWTPEMNANNYTD